jgi:hypothetical protein
MDKLQSGRVRVFAASEGRDFDREACELIQRHLNLLCLSPDLAAYGGQAWKRHRLCATVWNGSGAVGKVNLSFAQSILVDHESQLFRNA